MLNFSYTAGRNAKWFSAGRNGTMVHLGKQFYIYLPYDPAIPPLGIYQEKFKYVFIQILEHEFTTAFFIIFEN